MKANETQSQLLLLATLILFAVPVWAAQLEGRAVDAAGAPVANASVTTFVGSSTKTTRTDANGHFALTLDPGTYVVRVADATHEIERSERRRRNDAARLRPAGGHPRHD